ncbi:MAG: hypothetical protein KDK48_02255, partial [Chlamydiia bacterium]|nr:hypothetical protein [Chlamydiia bacterium]
MTTKALRLKGCNEHNLKNLSLSIPKECVVVVTGVSGSGKSSLAFDTLYAEGQRRYLEYLSPDVRAHIKLMKRPDVESIDGLSPTLATGHATLTQGRTTISSHTDIYDFLTLLFVKAGVQHSPATGKPLERLTRPEIVERILSEYGEGERIQLIAPIKLEDETAREAQQRLLAQGFVRILSGGEEVEEVNDEKDLEVVVDRLEMQEGIRERMAQSIETALDLSKGILKVQRGKSGEITYYTEIYVCPESGLSFPPLTAADFNPRSKRGACPACGGVGTVSRVDFSKFLWNKDLPLFDQITPFFKELPPATRRAAEDVLTALEGHPAYKKDPLKVLIEGLDEPLKVGKTHVQLNWKGLNRLFEDAKAEIPFSETSPCSLCHGQRLKPETLFCRIDGQSIATLEKMEVARLLTVLPKLAIAPSKKALTEEILPEILTRLQFLEEVGLGYLEMNRRFDTLSDGEAQRVELASLLGARLSGLLYVLDEPSRGLHPLDTKRLQAVVRALVEGSSVLMVEHDPQLILGADHIIEMGPGAGPLGGNVIFEGTPENLLSASDSPTGLWLKEKATPPFKKSAPA